MEIFKDIDAYCDLKIKSDKLRNKIRVLGSSFRKPNDEEKRNIEKASETLSKVDEQLHRLHSKIINKVKSFDAIALQEIIASILENKNKLNDKIKILNQKREEAVLKAKEACIQREVSGNFTFDNFADEYQGEILDIQSKIKSYQYFIDNIQYRIRDLDQNVTFGHIN